MVETNLKRHRPVNSKSGTDFFAGVFETRYFFDFSSLTRARKFLRSKYRNADSILSLKRLSSCIFARNLVKEFENLRLGAYFALEFGLCPETDDRRLMETDLARELRSETSSDGREGLGEFRGIENRVDVYVSVRKIRRHAYGNDRYDAEPFVFSGIPKALERNFGDAGGKVCSNLIGSGTHGW